MCLPPPRATSTCCIPFVLTMRAFDFRSTHPPYASLGPRISERSDVSTTSSQRSLPPPPTQQQQQGSRKVAVAAASPENRQRNTKASDAASTAAEWGNAVSALHGVNPRDPPMIQVLSQLPDFPIIGNQINDMLEYRCLGDLLPGTTDLAVYSVDSRNPISHARQ